MLTYDAKKELENDDVEIVEFEIDAQRIAFEVENRKTKIVKNHKDRIIENKNEMTLKMKRRKNDVEVIIR